MCPSNDKYMLHVQVTLRPRYIELTYIVFAYIEDFLCIQISPIDSNVNLLLYNEVSISSIFTYIEFLSNEN